MAKKMTLKEFKEVLEMAGISSSYEDILNQLAQNNHRMAEECRQMGLIAATRKCKEIGDVIYEELESRGYYKEVRL